MQQTRAVEFGTGLFGLLGLSFGGFGGMLIVASVGAIVLLLVVSAVRKKT